MGTIRGNKRGGSSSSGLSSGSSDVGAEWDFTFDIRPRRQQQNSILIVDDDPAQLNLLQIMVERAGYNVSTAESAQAALALIEEKQFNVVVSDF